MARDRVRRCSALIGRHQGSTQVANQVDTPAPRSVSEHVVALAGWYKEGFTIHLTDHQGSWRLQKDQVKLFLMNEISHTATVA